MNDSAPAPAMEQEPTGQVPDEAPAGREMNDRILRDHPELPEDIKRIFRENTTAQVNRIIGSGALADPLAGYLQLAGVKIGSGDLTRAMEALGLVLSINGEAGIISPPGDEGQVGKWVLGAAEGIRGKLAELTGESRCGKCGLPVYRLRDRDCGWWHVYAYGDDGYQRACWAPGEIDELPDDELDAAEAFLARRANRRQSRRNGGRA